MIEANEKEESQRIRDVGTEKRPRTEVHLRRLKTGIAREIRVSGGVIFGVMK
jgi:hypothetical protein